MNQDNAQDVVRVQHNNTTRHTNSDLLLAGQPSNMGTSLSPLNTSVHPLFTDLHQLRAHNSPNILMNRVEGGSEIHEELSKLAQEGVEEKISNEVFSSYQHNAILPGCLPHPGDIVEAGSLAHLPLPQAAYGLRHSLPTELITSGKLSSLQLEGILYACQRHQTILPNSSRAGFFLGDGAGVGKGRQIAGLIFDNFARKRTKHVWFSISSDLVVDARRDLTDIGCHIKVIEGCQQLDKHTKVFGLPADFKEGVIFSTYATLVSSVQRGGPLSSAKQTRLQQLVNWCGGTQFEGCLIFDECHKAKNFVPGKEQASTKVAMAVASIQRALPRARVVYCSATGVTDVKNMAFMERLGLWGEGAPFKSFEQFLDSIHRKGLGVAEMLAMEMKMSGMYLSRGLSFKQTEFMTTEIVLDKCQVQMYDTATHVWNELRKALESAIPRTSTTNNRIWSTFWSTHQRFFKQLCLGMKVSAVVAESKKALADNFCVVIGLQTTGEASVVSEMSKMGAHLKGFVSLCREMLTRFLEETFPTLIESKNGSDEPQHDQWCVTARNMLLDFAKKMPLPDSPLDEIIDRLGGPINVAEMTGRRGRIVRKSAAEEPQYELRECDSGLESVNVQERNLFMDGVKLVAIISDAASTGISLHADTRVANQRRRVHITFELPWSADKAVQQLGRSHRSNQSSGPLYKLTTTNLGGERRFASAVARRLQSLGAFTKGDRRAAVGADLTEFNFDTPYGRSALRSLYHGICLKTLVPGVELAKVCPPQLEFTDFNRQLQECLVLMGLIECDTLASGPKVLDKEARDVGKFLNRILGLSVGKQNIMFNYFCESMEACIQSAKREGRYNEGLIDITASSVTMKQAPKIIFEDSNKRGTTATKLLTLTVDRGMSWEAAMVRQNNHHGKNDSFYRSRREMRGKHLCILATQKENSNHFFTIARPNTGISSFEEDESDLMMKYVPISIEKAKNAWTQQYENAKTHCIHGPNCKAGRGCTVGSRCYTVSLLSGGIVTLMSVLELTISRYAPKLQLSKLECNIRVVRAMLDNGERVVGIRYPDILIPHVERAIKEQKAHEMVEMKQLMLADGQVVTVPVHKTPERPKLSFIESETPVSPKYVAKALAPPVTIKNWFKPIIKDTTVKTLACTLPPSSSTSTDRAKLATDICSSLKSTSKETQKVEVTPPIPNSNITVYSKRIARSSDVKPPAKKQKQSSLFASFALQLAKAEEKEVRKLTCPICSVKFDDGTSNQEVNKHIDICIIE